MSQEIPQVQEGDVVNIIFDEEPYISKSSEILRELTQALDQLRETDYLVLKWQEGWLTSEEFDPIRREREDLRVRIRDLQTQLSIAQQSME